MDIKNILKLDAVLKLPLSNKILIVVVLNAVIAGLFYYFLLDPKRVEMTLLKTNLDDLTAEIESNRRIAADIPKFEQEKAALEEQFKKALEQLPNEKEIPNLIDSISMSAKTSGLKIILFQPGVEVPKGFYSDVPVNMEVEGTFDSLYKFSEKVGKLPRIVNIGGLNISGAQGNVISLEPSLKARFVATTFRFVPEGEQQKATQAKGGKK